MALQKISTVLSLAVLLCVACTLSAWGGPGEGTAHKADIQGAGATFPSPLYRHWIKEYGKTSPGYSISYEATGSGDGVKRFLEERVDFAGSDSALNDKQMAAVKGGAQLIPATAGIIVLAYNIPDLKGELRLSRDVYADIFLGRIRQWNDARIQALNPGLALPNLGITTVVRVDSSGTTWAFTNHLNAVSKDWAARLGVGKKIDWPGNAVAARYNEGVAKRIQLTWGSIGYVEYGIAKRAGLAMAHLENREKQFVAPGAESGTRTLANTAKALPANLRLFLPDPEGRDSYPIATYTWLLLYKDYGDKTKADQVRKFVRWGLGEGQRYAQEFGYSPLPHGVAAQALKALESVH